ncbi:MAG TPA: cytochrome B [Maritimibacter sp.]|nr:cytochrome B [Maritimibacter sp.]
MSLTNGPDRFGAGTRVIHWVMALGIIGMLGFGTYLARMTVNMSNFHLFAWHKSFGITLLVLAFVRIVWHRLTPPPAPLPSVPWQDRLARGVHYGFYALLLLVPLTGWIASSATGIDVQLFGLTLPHIAPTSEAWEDLFFAAHSALTKLLAALVVLHIAGAVKRRDGTLRRMVRGRD